MTILFILIPLSLGLVLIGLWGFFWAASSGQFDELDTPAWDVLHDDAIEQATSSVQQREST